ncbi:MAG: thioredoxin-disulfide reductase [Marinilabiliales bacterium]
MEELYDVIIIGGGAAGLSAGIYASRAKLKTLILNEGAIGGQMILTDEIVNYPGVLKTNGYALANIMKIQAKDFGCLIKSNINIESFDLENFPKAIKLSNGNTYKSKSVILAMGGKPRPLGIDGEEKFRGKGISYCATCDGEFFTDKEIVVIGGGNSALEEAVALTKYASKVTIIHQFSHFQAFKQAVEEAEKNEKINFILESEPRKFSGSEKLETVTYEHLPTGKFYDIKADGAFIFVGYIPNTDLIKDIIKLNEKNEIIVNKEMKTNVPGVFAAGDCIEKKYRQVTTAVADGTVAALGAIEFIKT